LKERKRRPKLPAISEEMKAWAAALAGEAGNWPRVNTRAFFGFTALYRTDKIFALVPRTRGMNTANSLAFKLESVTAAVRKQLEKDPRIGTSRMRQARWFSFELSRDADLRDALDWLDRAYEAADKRKKSY
jgi:hypothetical protein